jgi:hypothetical protein
MFIVLPHTHREAYMWCTIKSTMWQATRARLSTSALLCRRGRVLQGQCCDYLQLMFAPASITFSVSSLHCP